MTLDELSGIRRNPDPVSSQVIPMPKPVSGSWNKDVTASVSIELYYFDTFVEGCRKC